jgi:hypothetical protein
MIFLIFIIRFCLVSTGSNYRLAVNEIMIDSVTKKELRERSRDGFDIWLIYWRSFATKTTINSGTS